MSAHPTPPPITGGTPPNPSVCEQLRELIPAYSIGATDPDETLWVEANLPRCPEAAAELAAFLALAEEMHYLVPATRQPHASEAPMPALPPVYPARPPREKAPRPAARPARRQPPWRGLLAVAAIALFALGGLNLVLLSRLRDLQTRQEALIQLAQQPPQPLSSGQVLHRELLPNQSVAVSPKSHATLIWNTAREVGSLYVEGLPPLEPDRVYQLWVVREGHSLSLGVFRVGEDGTGTLMFEAPERITDFSHVGISIEPAAGSPAPTTPHLVIGEI
jgi:anti-sigma-K factor RskA